MTKDNIKTRIKAWFIKQYRYFFIPKIDSYAVPVGERLYEMDLITMDIHKAEYHIVNKNRVLIKKENCIYQCAKDLHEVKAKFKTIIDKSLNRN